MLPLTFVFCVRCYLSIFYCVVKMLGVWSWLVRSHFNSYCCMYTFEYSIIFAFYRVGLRVGLRCSDPETANSACPALSFVIFNLFPGGMPDYDSISQGRGRFSGMYSGI